MPKFLRRRFHHNMEANKSHFQWPNYHYSNPFKLVSNRLSFTCRDMKQNAIKF